MSCSSTLRGGLPTLTWLLMVVATVFGAPKLHAEETGHLSGRVLVLGSITALPEATIEARVGEVVVETRSDAKGRFELSPPLGEAKVKVRHPEFETLFTTVAIGPAKMCIRDRIGTARQAARDAAGKTRDRGSNSAPSIR